MSWIKRRGQGTPSPATVPAPCQIFNPNQHSNQETQWQQSSAQAHDNWYNQPQVKPDQKTTQPQPDYWQQQYNHQQPPFNPPPQQQYFYQEQAGYYQNNPPYQQQAYGNLQYNSQQYNTQNNTYASQPGQQTEGDAWNWGWGDEDNSNLKSLAQQPEETEKTTEKVGNSESWNWGLESESGPAAITATTDKAKIDVDAGKLNPTIEQLTGKRGKLETPQWSMESQMSQESSDDVLQTSESDKSHMLSRSSTISHSPIGQELPPSVHLDDIQIKEDGVSSASSLHHFENKEIVAQSKQEPVQEHRSPDPTPPPLANTPLYLPQATDDAAQGNPYKHNAGLSHKAANKFRSENRFPLRFNNQTVNLETLPDNSEQPDPMPGNHQIRKVSPNNPPQQWPENNEAPINDRNQYLETGQLSDVDLNFGQGAEAGQEHDTFPPPGLRRMVLGQIEQNENYTVANFGDEPPFSRMVPGQLETEGAASQSSQPFEHAEPPEGLRRMIPGESSSPESQLRQPTYQLPQSVDRRDDSETEFNEISANVEPRSATIGADTPPAVANPTATVNRSETIGADTSPDPKTTPDPARARGTSGSSGNNTLGRKSKKSNRRDSFKGDDVGNMVNSVRNLTLGDNPSDGSNQGEKVRRHSRQESSDSEHEGRGKSPRDRRDRRYKDDRNRGRYSPEYRDKKYDKRRYKDRRYDDDTDYYSDKEKETRHKNGRDVEKKYGSLRKEKDKDGKRGDRKEYGRDARKGEYYYPRYEEDYENEPRSRASSRSDSMHDSYRDRDRGHDRERRDRRHRDKDRHRRHRDVFNPYSQGFGYDMYNQYYQQYQYYENLRKTNPQAYAQLYRKYYQAVPGEAPSYGGEERASVHSGRSSANDDLNKDRYTRQSYYSQTSLPHLGGYYSESQTHSVSGQYGLDESSFARTFDQTDNSLNYEDPHLAVQRLTPAKFATAHIKASITSGKLVKILPHYPLDGQSATIELSNLEGLLFNDDDYQELKQFPGPLVRGVTHKKTIIEYCESKIKDATYNLNIVDRDSYVLMWELLILLIRQNGMVVGTDIAELLLKNQHSQPVLRPSSTISSIDSTAPEGVSEPLEGASSGPNLKEEEVTNKFREYLLYGSGKEALEWAMKHGLWGHALFLASKLDKRTYANVLMRFANGLTMNDPLQTLYQLLSGKLPAAVTCIADEKWGDWRPHLAMILSNTTQRPELNCKAITTLGDTLIGRGSLFAGQFCYLMAESGFGRYENSEAKLVLLGSDHRRPFSHFATNEAIYMTEIYEYACSLNDGSFVLTEFQRYKYLLAARLADVGLLEKGLAYLEKIAGSIVKNPTAVEISFVNDVTKLADRLKFYDPVGDADEDGEFGVDLDTSRPDNSWLKDLRAVQNDLNNGALIQEAPALTPKPEPVYGQEDWLPQQYEDYQQQWNNQQSEPSPTEYQQPVEQHADGYIASQPYQEQQQQYWGDQQQWSNQASNYNQESVEQTQQSVYGSLAPTELADVEKEPSEDNPPPQISMPNHQNWKTGYDDDVTSDKTAKKDVPAKPKSESAVDKPPGNGWLGGIFSKLRLKPKNQMKLPDDKNPSIVWDPEKKKWINTVDDTADGGNDFKPPPKMSELMPKTQPPVSGQMPQTYKPLNFNQGLPAKVPEPTAPITEVNGKPPVAPQANMFKLQRGRNVKKSYIDVFNPNGKSSIAATQPAPLGGSQPTVPQMNFFMPQPVNDPNAPTDFLTPAPPLQFDESSQPAQ